MSFISAFDVMGPNMIGPSSSHTAGAARIAFLARKMLNGTLKKVQFTLYGSFAKTYHGHGTDRALLTQETIKKAVDYAKENNIKNIVVATTTGGNLTYLEDEKDLHIVGVTNVYDQGRNQMLEETRKHFEEAGMDIVTAGHALSGAERCFSTYFGGYGPIEIVANTLRMFSQGVKVCVEVSTMALDAGKIPYQEKIVAIAGSGRGADTVVLLTPSYTRSILDTKVHKIIEMPE